MVLGPNGLNELPEMRFEFPFNLIGKLAMAFKQAIHGVYSNPGTQVAAQNKDLGAVSQTDLTRVNFRLWRRLHGPRLLKFDQPEDYDCRLLLVAPKKL